MVQLPPRYQGDNKYMNRLHISWLNCIEYMPYHIRRWVDKLKAHDLFEVQILQNFMICTEIRDICHKFEQHAL